MRTEDYRERKLEVEGWPVNVASYKIGAAWHAKTDNVSPGALLARGGGSSREEAEQQALAGAREKLARTHRR